jgi:asparagine synthase (glutamine-hydrolysing)
MCGLTGFISDRPVAGRQTLTAMADVIRHRGPDDRGYWFDANNGVGLAHRRLSILDLSPAGHQPMTSESGRYVIVFNGEIYNHLEIRNELENSGDRICWRGHSDTETLLAGFETFGIEKTLQRSVGMFAMAVWDRDERSLILARDRIGEKPLYYGWNRGSFLFASELKAMRAYPGFAADISRDALALFLRHNYIPTPYSIYNGIFKLWPGAILTIQGRATASCPWDSPPFEAYQADGISLSRYWSLKDVAEKGKTNPFNGTDREAIDELERILSDAVRAQQISDVPLGAFLSGGVDSSTIVALMQNQSERPVRTFTIGFHEDGYNEAEYAGAVARHLGTEHTELYVTPQDALDVIPRLPTLYDEPFSDSSQIPTFLISQLTRKHVTVSLSGDAGDELFGGYKRYFLARSIWRIVKHLPYDGRKTLAAGIRFPSQNAWDVTGKLIGNFLPNELRSRPIGDLANKFAEILSVRQPDEMYRGLVSHWKSPADIVINAREPSTLLTDQSYWDQYPEFEQRMMHIDTLSYLPDDILVKVDRAAMGVSLETRVPFLDHRVVEFAWRLPLSMKIRNSQGKWILRQVLYKYVPRELIERPKIGFGAPIDSWLRGPLREWAESLLDAKRLREEAYFHPEPIRKKWMEHLSGKRNWQYYLWDVLMFQAWLQNKEADYTGRI